MVGQPGHKAVQESKWSIGHQSQPPGNMVYMFRFGKGMEQLTREKRVCHACLSDSVEDEFIAI